MYPAAMVLYYGSSTVHSGHYALHPAPFTLHPTPYAINPYDITLLAGGLSAGIMFCRGQEPIPGTTEPTVETMDVTIIDLTIMHLICTGVLRS